MPPINEPPTDDEDWNTLIASSRREAPAVRREPSGTTARRSERPEPSEGDDTPRGPAGRPRASGPSLRAKRIVVFGGGGTAVLLLLLAITGGGGDPAAEKPDSKAPARAAGPGAANGRPEVQISAKPKLGAYWTALDGSKSTVFVRWVQGASTALRGQLTTASGTPIVGANLDVLQRRKGQTQRNAVGSVTTDRDGVWTINVPIDDGAERRLTVQFLAHANDTVPAAKSDALLRVGADVDARLARSTYAAGQPAVVTGKIVSDLPKKTTIPVTVELAAPRGPWRAVATSYATDRGKGTFSAAVLVPADARGRGWRIRARVPDNARLGWLGAASDPDTFRISAK